MCASTMAWSVWGVDMGSLGRDCLTNMLIVDRYKIGAAVQWQLEKGKYRSDRNVSLDQPAEYCGFPSRSCFTA